MTRNQVFAADLARFDAMFTKADAIRTEADGFQWIDQSKVPAQVVSAYRLLMQYGYANGLI